METTSYRWLTSVDSGCAWFGHDVGIKGGKDEDRVEGCGQVIIRPPEPEEVGRRLGIVQDVKGVAVTVVVEYWIRAFRQRYERARAASHTARGHDGRLG